MSTTIDPKDVALAEGEPKILGYLTALREVVEGVMKTTDEIAHDRLPAERGKISACSAIEARVSGLIPGIREMAQAGNISGDEAMARRDLIAKAVVMVRNYSSEAQRECLRLDGERRAQVAQASDILGMISKKIAEEARKRRVADQRRERRGDVGATSATPEDAVRVAGDSEVLPPPSPQVEVAMERSDATSPASIDGAAGASSYGTPDAPPDVPKDAPQGASHDAVPETIQESSPETTREDPVVSETLSNPSTARRRRRR